MCTHHSAVFYVFASSFYLKFIEPEKISGFFENPKDLRGGGPVDPSSPPNSSPLVGIAKPAVAAGILLFPL